LVVIGGGALLDEAKYWRAEQRPALRLIAIPSIWGSGAEASPVVALNRSGRKRIFIGPRFLPDARAVWPELAVSIAPARARTACGDVWAHALEGFLSPLAGDALRAELAELMAQLLALPLANDPAWFEPSGRAAAGQARSSVGLAHGIAHALEGFLRTGFPGEEWGHARLCSLFLWPVMRFNAQASPKLQSLAAKHGLDIPGIMAVARDLFDEDAFGRATPLLKEHWPEVLRDPCSRTNSALVRPESLDYFLDRRFL
jgi:alcohol dehydrogenase class IV